jgi:hypothetical protein
LVYHDSGRESSMATVGFFIFLQNFKLFCLFVKQKGYIAIF